jgi:hypothetical protein
VGRARECRHIHSIKKDTQEHACFFPVDGTVDAVACYHVNVENIGSGSIGTKATLLPLHTLITRYRAGRVFGRRLRKVTMYLSVVISLSALAFVSPVKAIEKRTSPSLYLVGDSTMALHGVSQGIQGCVFGNNLL